MKVSRFTLREKLKSIIRENIERHRRTLILIGALCLLLLIVGLPLYFVSRPSYYARYRGIRPYYRSWRTSTHAEVSCLSCHVKPKRDDLAAFGARMVGEFYLRLVLSSNNPGIFDKPVNTTCLKCHSGLRTASPSGDLLIPHRAHVDVLKMKCIDCHGWVVHRKNPEGNHRPRMVTCLKCHDGKRASNQCTDCHKKKSFPVNHRTPGWLIVHSQKTEEIDCKSCHGWVPDYCEDCHRRRPVSHAGKWRTFHQLRVVERRNCDTCHKDPFCVKCHGEVP